MHLVAYHQIRRIMALAALEEQCQPWHVSFKGTLQTLNHFLPLLASCMDADTGCAALVRCVAAHVVGNRPDRYEPRRVKRRPKPYKLLQQPRAEYKRRIA